MNARASLRESGGEFRFRCEGVDFIGFMVFQIARQTRQDVAESQLSWMPGKVWVRARIDRHLRGSKL